ncbi:MAG: M28 family metallopeptidase [Promethearchaeota archaeon]
MIKFVSTRFGSRYDGSDAEKQANEWIKNKLVEFCDETHLETFPVHPDYYPQGMIKITGFFAGIAWIFAILKVPWNLFSTVFVSIGVVVLVSGLVFRKRWLNFIFKKRTSCNVYGIIQPGDVERWTVILDAHVDSAKEMRFARKVAFPLMRVSLGISYLLYTLVFPIIKVIVFLIFNGGTRVYIQHGFMQWSIVEWFYFIPWLVLYPCFLYTTHGFTGDFVVPGAGDNLSRIATILAVGKYYSEHRPKNVKIVIASMGSEETGAMGARYFVEHHADILKNSHAYVIDNTGVGNCFHITAKDIIHRITMSPEVVDRMKEAADKCKKEKPDTADCFVQKSILGSSDGGMYVQGGFKAATIIGKLQDAKKKKRVSKPPNWHSKDDTWQNISKKMLADSIAIAIKYIKLLDDDLEKEK